ncbi:unnamed protein product [Ceutorhynchus assimilis]|uniref:Uncharacterized protein n=1 Tax=Ceutorhynchus assimilis TaxID=467358 RepID=A0A9N9QRL6_9CUCU|nr:unnamed protein product [Ceutorhynchus assimilis]
MNIIHKPAILRWRLSTKDERDGNLMELDQENRADVEYVQLFRVKIKHARGNSEGKTDIQAANIPEYSWVFTSGLAVNTTIEKMEAYLRFGLCFSPNGQERYYNGPQLTAEGGQSSQVFKLEEASVSKGTGIKNTQGDIETTLSLLHYNVRSLRNKVDNLEAALGDANIDIVCLTEHWLIEEELAVLSLDGYKVATYLFYPWWGYCDIPEKIILLWEN